MSRLKLRDRADMCRGHYCIARVASVGPTGLRYWEYWSESSQGFASAGTVYVGRPAAMAKLKQIRASISYKVKRPKTP